MTADVVVRDARAADLPDAVRLVVAGALGPSVDDGADGAGYADALAELTRPPCALLVADEGGEVVGVCQLVVFRHLQHRGGRCAELESLHVRSDRRGRGIGSRLVAEALARARSAGCYRVQLTSNRSRTDAHRFYERLGFAPTHVGYKLVFE